MSYIGNWQRSNEKYGVCRGEKHEMIYQIMISINYSHAKMQGQVCFCINWECIWSIFAMVRISQDSFWDILDTCTF